MKPTKTFMEKAASEEWGAWKFVSEMLDNPNESGIYPTSVCYEKIHDFVVEQKQKASIQAIAEAREEVKNAERMVKTEIWNGHSFADGWAELNGIDKNTERELNEMVARVHNNGITYGLQALGNITKRIGT